MNTIFSDEKLKAVVQITGKDDNDFLKKCVDALGKDRVIGIIMPNLNSAHTKKAVETVKDFNIEYHIIPITAAVASIWRQIEYSGVSMSGQAHIKLPNLVRNATLDSVAKSIGGKVITEDDLS